MLLAQPERPAKCLMTYCPLADSRVAPENMLKKKDDKTPFCRWDLIRY